MINRQLLKNLIDKLPYVKTLKDKLKEYEPQTFVPLGHFYSPIVAPQEVLENQNQIFDTTRSLMGINLDEEEQFKLLENFKDYYGLLFFSEDQDKRNRFFYNNDTYSYADVIFLFSMMMHCKPKRIIEIGSGFSSAAMLDINDKYFNNSIEITFIEPFPVSLKQVIKPGDKFTLVEKKVQQVDLNMFKALERNDILFIDSTHVGKTGSDVLFEIFEILPLLNNGVKIHFHDIFYPFEYPKSWVVEENRSWNEIYFLRSFLMYNSSFRILSFNTYLQKIHSDWFEQNMPLCKKNIGGSCWLEKVA